MKRPLYLDGGHSPITVSLDGPALRLRQAERADARAPLRLLSRVVVSGGVSWTTSALLACCDAGVHITFLRGDGGVRGWCVSESVIEPDINVLLEEVTLLREWPGQQEDWLRGVERRAIAAAIYALDLSVVDLRPSAAWAACEAWVDRLKAPIGAATIMHTFTGALAAQLTGLLRGEGVATRFILGYGAPIRLAYDFQRVLIWRLWPQADQAALYLCRHAGKHRSEATVRRRLVRRYEAATSMMEATFGDLFRRLRWRLKELLP